MWTLAEMRQALARHAISPAELLAEHERQRQRLEPQLNAISQLLAPPLAQSADGPLAGIPLTVKDSLDIAGYATICGHAPRQTHRASRHAVAVERLLAAGAVITAKTATPELLMNWETFTDWQGPTRNPWKLDCTAGGSSGGESAAIAGCYSAGGVGSDGGGSIRLPAALTGIVGLKPTPGRVPAAGHFPPIAHPGGLLGVIGPMARTVEDVELLFGVLGGHDDGDPFSIPFTPLPVPDDYAVGVVDHPVVDLALPWLPNSPRRFAEQPWQRLYDVWEFFFLRLNAHPIGFATPHTERYLAEATPTAAELLAMLAARDALRMRFLAALDECPVLLLPNPGFGAWPVGQFPGPAAMAPLTVANLLGLPALAIPVGFDAAGLPLSVQAVAKPWHEELLLAFGRKLEEARGPFPLAPLALNA